MPAILSHPFRLGADGAAVTVEDGSDAANAEAVAVLLLTRLGERELVPEFGTPDPVFGEVTLADLNGTLDLFGPAVTVESVVTTPITDTASRVDVTFTED